MAPHSAELTACLVVRDEQALLGGCLASLVGLADHVIVYDTGSTDGTVALARAAGALVLEGYWDDDFARARNAALAAADSTWILSIDADERATADAVRLRTLLAETPDDVDGLRTEIRNVTGLDGVDTYSSFSLRVFRREARTWRGRIHEDLQANDGRDATHPLAELPGDVLRLTHDGYSDATQARVKAVRNATIGLAELQGLTEQQSRADAPAISPAEFARVLLNLGRSLMACDQPQDAIDAFQAVRELPGRGPEFAQATDFMARLTLGANQPADTAVLVGQLRDAGVNAEYCNWLEAQALAQLGQAERAYQLLTGVHRVVDAAGRDYGPGRVLEMRALAAALTGHHAAAVAEMVEAMARYGRVSGRGALLLEWWGDRPLDALRAEFSRHGDRYRDVIEREIADCRVS